MAAPCYCFKSLFLSSNLFFLPNIRIWFSFCSIYEHYCFMIKDFFPLLISLPFLSFCGIQSTIILLDNWGYFLGVIYRYKHFPQILHTDCTPQLCILSNWVEGLLDVMWKAKGNSPWVEKQWTSRDKINVYNKHNIAPLGDDRGTASNGYKVS